MNTKSNRESSQPKQSISTRKPFYWLAIFLIPFQFFIVFWLFARRDIYLIAHHPEKYDEIILTRRRIPPYIQGVIIEIEVTRPEGPVFRQKIANLDEWTDPLEYFNSVNWEDGNIIIGPGKGNGPIILKQP